MEFSGAPARDVWCLPSAVLVGREKLDVPREQVTGCSRVQAWLCGLVRVACSLVFEKNDRRRDELV